MRMAVAPHESPWVVTVPLIALAIPSVIIGALTVELGAVRRLLRQVRSSCCPANDVVAKVGEEFDRLAAGGPARTSPSRRSGSRSPGSSPPGCSSCGDRRWRMRPQRRFGWLKSLLDNKYYFDWFNENVIAPLTRGIGLVLWKGGDQVLIDGALVNGTAATVGWFGSIVRRVQSGYLYSYAFWMMIGLALMLGWFLFQAND